MQFWEKIFFHFNEKLAKKLDSSSCLCESKIICGSMRTHSNNIFVYLSKLLKISENLLLLTLKNLMYRTNISYSGYNVPENTRAILL